jgi:dTDP-glucose 4,6-dehydratase
VFRPQCILVTGGAGFIGSNFIRWVLHRTDVHVVNFDALTYAGNIENLSDVDSAYGSGSAARYRFVRGDVRDLDALTEGLRVTGYPAPDCVVHMAAESHVDRSIMGPAAFVETNVGGTLTLLEACRAELNYRPRPFRFVQVGTDEVYGSLAEHDPAFTEQTPIRPNSPYSASKAGADLLVRSYVHTFGFPAIVTRCSNNYGPYQFPEKLIPLMITRALADQPLPVYGDGLNVRDWLHVEDHAAALWSVLTAGAVGEVYNIGGRAEHSNIEVVKTVLSLLHKPHSLIQYVQDRAGHDRRYAMNTDRICRELGWNPVHRFERGLADTVNWYVQNRVWWERVLSEAYKATNALYLRASG